MITVSLLILLVFVGRLLSIFHGDLPLSTMLIGVIQTAFWFGFGVSLFISAIKSRRFGRKNADK
jgi:cyanate permease